METRNSPRVMNHKQDRRKINTEDRLVNYIKTQLGHPLITVDVTDEQVLQCIDDAFIKWGEWNWDGQQNMVFVIETFSGIQDYYLDERVKAIYGMSIADTTSGYSSGGNTGMWGGLPMGEIMPPMYMPAITMQGETSSLSISGPDNGSATGVAGGVAGGPNTGGDSNSNPLESAWSNLANMQTWQNMFGKTISFEFNESNHILRLFQDVGGPVAIEASMDYIPDPDFDDAYGHQWLKKYALNLVKRVWGQNLGKYDSQLIGGANINYDRIISEAQQEIDQLEEQLLMESESLGIWSG